MCQLYLSKCLIVVRKSASRARPARRRDHAHGHADLEGCTVTVRMDARCSQSSGSRQSPDPLPLYTHSTLCTRQPQRRRLYMRRRRGIRLLVPVAAATEVATAAAKVAATVAATAAAAVTAAVAAAGGCGPRPPAHRRSKGCRSRALAWARVAPGGRPNFVAKLRFWGAQIAQNFRLPANATGNSLSKAAAGGWGELCILVGVRSWEEV